MNSKLCSVNEAEKLIASGKHVLVAGEESLLKRLPRGNWIGGTIPYFMADEGGVITKDRLFVTELPAQVARTSVKLHDEKSLQNVYKETPRNGFSFIIVPASSQIHLSFAINAPHYPEFATRPLVGWVSGVHLNDLGKATPKVIDGKTGELSDSKAAVMQIEFAANYVCDAGIVNIFSQGNGDTLEFIETGFSVKDVLVNGKKTNFADYLLAQKADTRLPLVANYAGANINVSFQGIDEKSKTVNLYAPVFKGVSYRLAAPVQNYVEEFQKMMPKGGDELIFSCNCILNFLHSELEGKKTGGITGPITFGEVAFQLLNQTMVYLTLVKI